MYALKLLLLPPASNFLLLGLAWLLRRRRGLSTALAALSLGSLLLLSIPRVASVLLTGLETTPAVAADQLDGAQAIVVLAGGRLLNSPEYGDTINSRTLARVRYGAWLSRATGLPILVTGGIVFDPGPAEATLMARVLEEEFGMPPRWVETASRNTCENATLSAELLKADAVGNIVLVTHALHMPRALDCFSRYAGLAVQPAPTTFLKGEGRGHNVFDWLPTAYALSLSRAALHEYLGLAWYRLRYR
ncbi:MAG: YdcF family protein [Gammaproteobacteria bacterium]|nr:YdcF family protein [Gammaproteobacteria bacterium]